MCGSCGDPDQVSKLGRSKTAHLHYSDGVDRSSSETPGGGSLGQDGTCEVLTAMRLGISSVIGSRLPFRYMLNIEDPDDSELALPV